MFQKEQAVSRLIEILVEYIPNLKAQIEDFSKDYFAQRALLRGLMNMHSEKNPLPEEFFSLQDELLQQELSEKQIIDESSLNHVFSIRMFLYTQEISLLLKLMLL